MDFDKLSNTEKIALIKVAIKIHEISETGKIPIGYRDFDECAKSMVEKAKKLANQF
jgi:hypothetical protein